MRLDEVGEKTFLNQGAFGKCYELENGTVLKLFNDAKKLYEMDKFKHMSKYENENFLFPFDFVYDEKNLYGYIMKKSLGQSLDKTICDINLEIFSEHCKLLEKNIEYISQGKIVLRDFHEKNVLYDKEIMEVIDFDFYRVKKEESETSIKKENIYRYKDIIIQLLRKNISGLYETGYILNKLGMYVYMNENVLPSDIIIYFKEEIQKYYKEQINTINDLQLILRR